MIKKSVIISVLTAIIVSVWGCEPEQQYLSSKAQTPVVQSEQETDIEQQAKVAPEPDPVPEPEPAPELEPVPEPELKPEPAPKAEPEPEAATAPTTDAETDKKPAKKPAEKSKEPLKEKAPPPGKAKLPAFYKKCDHIFATYVDKQGLVNYKMLRRKRGDLLPATKEFDELHPAVYMSWSNNEKIAFWINAYNIFTLKLISDNYPIKPRSYLLMFYPKNSVMHITGWNKKIFNVMGIEYTLQEIEQEMLLQKFNDPRIGFALSLASMSSPPLPNKCYRPDTLDKQLDEQMTRYMANPRGLQIDNGNKVIKLSDIFKRYKEPIIKKYDSIKKFRKYPPHIKACFNFIVGYVSADVAQAINTQNYTISFQQYDWGLNEQPKK